MLTPRHQALLATLAGMTVGVAVFGTVPFGSLFAGFMADWIGPANTIAIGGAACVAGAACGVSDVCDGVGRVCVNHRRAGRPSSRASRCARSSAGL